MEGYCSESQDSTGVVAQKKNKKLRNYQLLKESTSA
jgi:hypothetical protein